jgi:hypothetical protein
MDYCKFTREREREADGGKKEGGQGVEEREEGEWRGVAREVSRGVFSSARSRRWH